MGSPFQPREDGVSWKIVSPPFKRIRHCNAKFLDVVHDGRARVRRKNIGPELGAGEPPAYVHNETNGLPPLLCAFSRISENDVETGSNSGLQAALSGLVDRIEILKRLVHQFQDFGRRGIDALADLMEAGPSQQAQLVGAQASCKVRCGLNAPPEP